MRRRSLAAPLAEGHPQRRRSARRRAQGPRASVGRRARRAAVFESPRVEVDFAAKSRTLCRVRPSTRRLTRTCAAVLVLLLCGGAGGDVSRDAVPPEAPRFKPPSRRGRLGSDFFHDTLRAREADPPGVWV